MNMENSATHARADELIARWRSAFASGAKPEPSLRSEARNSLLEVMAALEHDNARLHKFLEERGLVTCPRSCTDALERALALEPLLANQPDVWFCMLSRILNEQRMENVWQQVIWRQGVAGQDGAGELEDEVAVDGMVSLISHLQDENNDLQRMLGSEGHLRTSRFAVVPEVSEGWASRAD